MIECEQCGAMFESENKLYFFTPSICSLCSHTITIEQTKKEDVSTLFKKIILHCECIYYYMVLKIENQTTDISISTRNQMNDFVCDMV